MNVVIGVMIFIAVLVSNVICQCVPKSVRQDVNVHLEHMKIDLDSVFRLVTRLSVQSSKNAQTIKFGIVVATNVATFIAVQKKNVSLHLVPRDATLVVNVLVECTQVHGISIYV